jgi:hypothetical protein
VGSSYGRDRVLAAEFSNSEWGGRPATSAFEHLYIYKVSVLSANGREQDLRPETVAAIEDGEAQIHFLSVTL